MLINESGLVRCIKSGPINPPGMRWPQRAIA